MRLLAILLLCCHCLLGSATVIDADCNDQIVFNAVDEALKSFNNAKEEGNQLILYRITDAKIKNEEDGQIHHFVEYETNEGSCEVKSGKSWQECAPTYAYQAKCSAHVLFDKDLKLRSVESQNCSSPTAIEWPPVTAVHHPCLGCPQPVDKENKELLCFVHSTIEQINTDANHPFYFDLESIVNATRQPYEGLFLRDKLYFLMAPFNIAYYVVGSWKEIPNGLELEKNTIPTQFYGFRFYSNFILRVAYGWEYHIEFHIRQTNCSKYNFTSKSAKECKIDKEGEFYPCTAMVHLNPDGEVYYPFLKCNNLDTGVCLNCPVEVNPEDPELVTLLVQVMDEYNFNSNHTELYKVNFVETAVKKGFQRELYEINFIIKPTNCSKPDYSFLGDECAVTQDSVRLYCTTKINVTDKTVNVHSAPQCGLGMQAHSIRYGYGGLSPLRISRSINLEEDERNSMLKFFKPVERTEQPRQRRHGHNNNKEHKHDRKSIKNKEEMSKQKYQHQDSSEEDKENEVTHAPLHLTNPAIQKPGNLPAVQKAPDVSNDQETSPNTDETFVLDFPGRPTDVVPRCPGRVWQPKSQIPSIPTVQTFSIDDLALAIDDLTSDQDIEKNEPITSNQNPLFNDEDLLS